LKSKKTIESKLRSKLVYVNVIAMPTHGDTFFISHVFLSDHRMNVEDSFLNV